MDRREFAQSAVSLLVSGIAGTSVSANVTDTEHPHPHVTSHTPSHNAGLFGRPEHAFLMQSTTRFAGMPLCQIVIQHGHYMDLETHARAASITEYVPFYVNPENEVTQISRLQLAGIFSGSIRNWREIGGNDLPITRVIRGGETYTGAHARMIANNFFSHSERKTAALISALSQANRRRTLGIDSTDSNLVFGGSYESITEFVTNTPGAIAASVRPSFSSGLRSLDIDGNPFGSSGYPIAVTSHLAHRLDVDGADRQNEQLFAELLVLYQEDSLAVS